MVGISQGEFAAECARRRRLKTEHFVLLYSNAGRGGVPLALLDLPAQAPGMEQQWSSEHLLQRKILQPWKVLVWGKMDLWRVPSQFCNEIYNSHERAGNRLHGETLTAVNDVPRCGTSKG